MEIIWIIIEISATFFENYIVLDTIDKMFGYKYSERKKLFIITLLVSTVYVTVINQFFSFEGWLAIITIIIFTIYSAFFTKKRTNIKYFVPVILFSVILCINISVTYLMGVIFGTPETFVFISLGGARLFALFITKLIFYIVSRIIIRVYKKENFEFNKSETFITSVLFLLTLIISISLVKLQLYHRNEDQLIFLSIFCIFYTR